MIKQISAYAAMGPKEALKPFTYEVKGLGPYEILVDVLCGGVCHSDISLIDNEWGVSSYPLVPGHEVVGVISEVGSRVSKELLHQRVGVGWQRGACLTCKCCLAGYSHVCKDKTLTCLKAFGGFAKQLVADSRFTYLIPEKLSSEIAAPLLCAGATVFSPLSQSRLPAKSRVAILGVGGLGHLALQFAKALNYHVTAISSSHDKEEESKSFGADAFLSLSELTEKEEPFDLILSTYKIGNIIDQIVPLIAPFGTLCLVTRESFTLSSGPLLSFERRIRGTTTASPTTMRVMLEFAAERGIAPKIEMMPFTEINEAVERVRQGKARYRIVLTRDSSF